MRSSRPARPCSDPSCPYLALNTPRCAKHERIYQQQRGGGTARGYGYQWQQARAAAILEHPFCTNCGTTSDLTGDHVIPLSRGGTQTYAGIRVLCRSCNSRRGNR